METAQTKSFCYISCYNNVIRKNREARERVVFEHNVLDQRNEKEKENGTYGT